MGLQEVIGILLGDCVQKVLTMRIIRAYQKQRKCPSFETCLETPVFSVDFFLAPTYTILILSGKY